MGNNKNILIAIGALMVFGLVALGVLSRKNTTKEPDLSRTTQEVPTAPKTTAATTPSNVMVKTIEIEAGSFYYKPNEIRVKKGETVTITLTAVDMMHDFNVDELDVHVPITRAETTNTATFTADKAGTFEYYCSVGQHRKNGQIGSLIVE